MNNSLKLRNRKAVALFLTKRSETLLTAIKKTVFAFLLLLSGILAVQAQSNFKPGYIITNQQDTVTGWINFRTDQINQKQCEFKPDLKLAVKIYLPEDIAGYRFKDEGKYYVSREINLNETPQKVFLEFLVKGIMNLYYYTNEIDYYFFENQDGKMEIISQKPEQVVKTGVREDGKRIIRKDMRYVGQIRYLFRDYQPIVQKANRLNFDQKSMMSVVEEYHNDVCTTGESCIIFRNTRPDDFGWRVKFSVYTGLQLSNYAFNKNIGTPTKLRYATFTQSNVSHILGLQANLINPRRSKSFSTQLDVSFSQFKGDMPDEISRKVNWIKNGVINPAAIKATSYEALASSFRLGVKYAYPKHKLSPIVEAGVVYTNLKEDQDILRHNYYGYYLALGANYNIKSHAIFILFVYDNYLSTDGLQEYSRDKISMPHVKIGYTF
jgi:uncharacterized protein YfkK (UPF0435 family)